MTPSTDIPCIVCGTGLSFKTARGRKSGKPFLSLICEVDGSHFRAFIDDQSYVKQVLARLEGQIPSSNGGDEADANLAAGTCSKANLERDNC